MTTSSAALAFSLAVKRERDLLGEMGRDLGTPVVFLKAAWSDPVLYGGRGARRGIDLDALVEARAFDAFVARLLEEGAERIAPPNRPGLDAYAHAYPFTAASGVLLDLHRQLTRGPWFYIDPGNAIARAVEYDSPDGPILSLCPEDQVLFAAAHYGAETLGIDDRHLEDIVRLSGRSSIDWLEVADRARRGNLESVLGWLGGRLRGRGVHVPPVIGLSVSARSRVAMVERAMKMTMRYGSSPFNARRLACLTVLSDRPSALPRFFVEYGGGRLRDAINQIR